MGYHLEGSILEVCDCQVLCPCWVGEDPDGGICNTAMAWHFDRGVINNIEVTGLTLGLVGHIPGNILKGSIRAIFFVDDRATTEQQTALIDVYTGVFGGPISDFAQLIGEVVKVERAPILFQVEKSKGLLKIGTTAEASIEPFLGPSGTPTTLHDTVFSTIPGSPAYVGKSKHFCLQSPSLGIQLDLEGHNAIQGTFCFEHS